MTPAFEKAFNKLMEYEGKFSNHPEDRGGETWYGIARRFHPEVEPWPPTLQEARKFYQREYWWALRLDEVLDERISAELFEQAVNFGDGVKVATEHAQEAVNYLGASLQIDGIMGPKTLAAINGCLHPEMLLKLLNGLQVCRYIRIVKAKPSQKVFARGWLRRVQI